MSDKLRAALHGQTFHVGEWVTIGQGTTLYKVVKLVDTKDAAGLPYTMASVVNETGRVGEQVETTRLRKTNKTGSKK